MNTTDKIMAQIHAYKTAGTIGEMLDLSSTIRAEITALVLDAEELAFLKNDLLSWVDHAVEKGNANSDIQEASERYDQWLKTRHAAMQEKQS